MKRVLITGDRGYIGTVMTRVMRDAGYEVVGLDSGFFDDCLIGPKPVDAPSLKKDIRDVTAKDLEGFHAVLHNAALCNDPLGDLNANWTYDINHKGTVHLANLAKAAGVQRFVYASSCSMYGAGGNDFLPETAPLNPLTPYAVSKVRAEEDLARLADSTFSPIFMRNATAYGFSPRLRADIVLNNLVCWGVTTKKIRILSDGTPWRPIVHIEDISRAFLAVVEAPRDAIHNEAFNIGDDSENYQVRDLAQIVKEVVPGCDVEIGTKNNPDPRDYRVNFGKIRKHIPTFKCIWTARKGAEEMHRQFVAAGLTLEDFQGRKYIRLNQLKHLISTQLDGSLRFK